MAYNRHNHLKRVRRVIEVYNEVKEPDIPDTYIVKHIFPKHNILICYNTWMAYKGMKRSEYQQPTLFD